MKTSRTLARRVIGQAAKCSLIRTIAYVVREESESFLPSDPSIFDVFTDSRGRRHELVSGLRDRLKPGWQTMLARGESAHFPSTEDIKRRRLDAMNSVATVLRFLESLGYCLQGKEVLEIGCYDGMRCYALAKAGARSVMGTDIARYAVLQKIDARVSNEEISRQNEQFARLRQLVAYAFARSYGAKKLDRVTFVEDDITDSSLDNSYDLVFSWDVLEHLKDPTAAFRNMARLLKPGGLAFPEYNPFFAINGGHSLCTLDFFWGHASVSTDDFRTYVRQYRPREEEVAMRFFKENLNRMTFGDLRSASLEAGLAMFAFITWNERGTIRYLTPAVLRDVKEIHHRVTIEDLLARDVWVAFKRP